MQTNLLAQLGDASFASICKCLKDVEVRSTDCTVVLEVGEAVF